MPLRLHPENSPRGRLSRKKSEIIRALSDYPMKTALMYEIVTKMLIRENSRPSSTSVWNQNRMKYNKTLRDNPYPMNVFNVNSSEISLPVGLAIRNRLRSLKLWDFIDGDHPFENVIFCMDRIFMVGFYLERGRPRLKTLCMNHGLPFGTAIVSMDSELGQAHIDELARTDQRAFGIRGGYGFQELNWSDNLNDLDPLPAWDILFGVEVSLVPLVERQRVQNWLKSDEDRRAQTWAIQMEPGSQPDDDIPF